MKLSRLYSNRPAVFNAVDFASGLNVVFAEIPKTSTGKIQKFKLREMTKGV